MARKRITCETSVFTSNEAPSDEIPLDENFHPSTLIVSGEKSRFQVFSSDNEEFLNLLTWDKADLLLNSYMDICKPDAVLIDIKDIQLDELIEFTSLIRSKQPFNALFIMATFSDIDTGAINRLFEAGISDICESESNVQILRNRLNLGARLVRGQQKIDQINSRFNLTEVLAEIGYWEWSPSRDAMFWSGNTFKILGLAPESSQLSLSSLLDIIEIEERSRVDHQFQNIINDTSLLEIECRMLHADGELRDILIIAGPEYRDGKLETIVGYLQDITEQKLKDARTRETSSLDTVTGPIDNKFLLSHLNSTIEISKQHNRQFSLLHLEIDDFSQITESLGVQSGDQVLRNVSIRTVKLIREEDIFAQISDDKFIILALHQTNNYTAAYLVSKIHKAFTNPIQIENKQVQVNLNVGIAVYPEDGQTPSALFKAAEYAAKNASLSDTGYAFHSKTIGLRANEQLATENALKQAVEQDEFRLHYQPKLSSVDGAIKGMEALIRWKRPGHGDISPLEFIPLAESTGHIHQLGTWVLENACKQASIWNQNGRHLTIAVNISPRQLEQSEFFQDVKLALEKYGLLPNQLELEVTESCIQTSPIVIETLDKCRLFGIKIAIDDFGTGHSTLSSLKNLPADTLKIDREFLADIPANDRDKAIVSAIINIAGILDLNVVAEGVETQEQINFLCEAGCNQLQGYYISTPKPADEFEALLSPGLENHFIKPKAPIEQASP
jgi:diguanylate cyclase (GGDEF)-like protein